MHAGEELDGVAGGREEHAHSVPSHGQHPDRVLRVRLQCTRRPQNPWNHVGVNMYCTKDLFVKCYANRIDEEGVS